jgi:glycosyltransferase involved in cell wall biosynthesis
MDWTMSKFSIVIPAFNEEASIGALLSVLKSPEILSACEVFVICNGCNDATFAIASSFEGIVTSESEPGKAHALNKGDEMAGDMFPRLYLDADVRINVDSVLALFRALDTNSAAVAGPRVQYALAQRPFTVRHFYGAYETVPAFLDWRLKHLEGRGVYGASRAARARFGLFPNVRADDAFFDRQFTAEEKQNVDDALTIVSTPDSLHQLVRNEVRVASGNRELVVLFPELKQRSTATKPKWISSWHDPQLTNLLVWLVIHSWVRLQTALRRGAHIREPWR